MWITRDAAKGLALLTTPIIFNVSWVFMVWSATHYRPRVAHGSEFRAGWAARDFTCRSSQGSSSRHISALRFLVTSRKEWLHGHW
jgi:hypothetical protein